MTKTRVMRRHDARTLALSALYCWELTRGVPVEVFDQVADGFFGSSTPPKPSGDKRFEYSKELFLAAVSHPGEIDTLIAKASQGWQVSRMPRVDLSILRLALAEVIYMKETPMEIVIDEALELSKEYSTQASPRFVNGVLMGIFRETGYAKNHR